MVVEVLVYFFIKEVGEKFLHNEINVFFACNKSHTAAAAFPLQA